MPVLLPVRPSLDQYRRQAKELLRGIRAGDPAAIARFRRYHPEFRRDGNGEIRPQAIRLADAQWVLAREHGFASWPKFARHLRRVIEAGIECHPFEREIEYYEGRAYGLWSVLQTGDPRAIDLVRLFHPRCAGASDAEICAGVTEEDARLVTAREHGCESWAELVARIEALASGARSEPFMEAFAAIRAGEIGTLRALLRQHPWLVNAKGTNGNRLLTLATSLRQTDAVRVLLRAGADPNMPNNKGWTPLHQVAYAGDRSRRECFEILELLVAAGASPTMSAHGDGGTPLVQALFWGHAEMAERLAELAIEPDNLRVAAGLGRLDLVQACFDADGNLLPHAGAHRAFHRPHSGFPAWTPSNDRQEILDEALTYAARNGRVAVIPFLVAQGADVNADPYRGTPLAWAAVRGHHEVVGCLLDHGADVNLRGTFGGPQHGEGIVALHLAAQQGDAAMVRHLLERGADPTVADAIYRSTPAGWARHFGHEEVARLIEEWPRSAA